MVGRHHRLSGHEFEQGPGDSDGQGGLACGSACGHKGSDTTERLNRTQRDDRPSQQGERPNSGLSEARGHQERRAASERCGRMVPKATATFLQEGTDGLRGGTVP